MRQAQRRPASQGPLLVRPRSALALLALAAVTLVTLGFGRATGRYVASVKSVARDVVAPVDAAVRAVVRPAANFVQGAASYSSLRVENAKLRAEVARLKVTEAGAAATRAQLAQLSRLEHLSFAGNLPKIPADVVAGSSSNFEVTVQLDKGGRAGVKVGMPVVAGGGLVGHVVAVALDRSTVQLVTDPASALGVRLGGGTGSMGLAVGQGASSPLRVQYVPPQQRVQVGEAVVTTQVQGGTVPSGIPVGAVSKVTLRPGALQQQITVRPYVNLGNLAFVSILRWVPPGP